MIFNLKPPKTSTLPLRVTPDPDRAAQLLEKMNTLRYHPTNGFHRDARQDRQRTARFDR